jgi:uncharacterized protein (TIGR03437 family)
MKNSLSKFVPFTILVALLITLAPPNQAQVQTTLTRVFASPTGPEFIVDGGTYNVPMSAFWPIGSKHVLNVPQGFGLSYNLDQTIMYTFQGWQWSGGSLAGNPITVTADPGIQQYQAVFSAQYKFALQFFTCSDVQSCAAAPGYILVNGVAVTADTFSWQAPGTGITLQAFANPGYIFAGWRSGANQTILGFQNSIVMNGPMTVYPLFVPSKTVTVDTNPAGVNLKVYVDGVEVVAPATMQWGEGTSHSITTFATQNDNVFQPWVFTSWTDGGALTHNYIVGNTLAPEKVVANYTPGIHATYTTSPGGLTLTVDGLTLPPPYDNIWGIGTKHTVTAPLTQTDTQGGVWQFSKWDDGSTAATRNITVPTGTIVNGIRNLAIYAGQSRLTVNSSVAGVPVTVDGTACNTPCSVLRAVGTQVHVTAPASIAQGSNSRQDFVGWSTNGGGAVPGDLTITLNDAATTINAAYHLMNHLTTAANPSAGVQWSISPASPDGFYDSLAQVNLAVTPRPGYKFSVWSGDLSGTLPSGTLSMSVPRAVMAQLISVPYISAPALNNAAAVTPQQTVAPGSVASIFGVNLATTAAIGPASQLVQTLAGASVHIGNSYLPLFFASPVQINLQVPPDMQPGQQTITVSPQGMPDVSASFIIARNAPGLFPMTIDGQSFALALHEDGTLVTPDLPAKQGELLTVYGTGFGPTDHARPFGFPVPATPPYLVVDPVSLQLGDSPLAVESAFALPGTVGVDAVQFRLDSTVPNGTYLNFQITINGVISNTLLLPVK